MLFDRLRDYDAFDDVFEEENAVLEEYAIGKEPAQCQECGEWIRAKDLCGDVCEDCAYEGYY